MITPQQRRYHLEIETQTNIVVSPDKPSCICCTMQPETTQASVLTFKVSAFGRLLFMMTNIDSTVQRMCHLKWAACLRLENAVFLPWNMSLLLPQTSNVASVTDVCMTNLSESLLMKWHLTCLISTCAYLTLCCSSLYVNLTALNSALCHITRLIRLLPWLLCKSDSGAYSNMRQTYKFAHTLRYSKKTLAWKGFKNPDSSWYFIDYFTFPSLSKEKWQSWNSE